MEQLFWLVGSPGGWALWEEGKQHRLEHPPPGQVPT